MRLKLIKIFVVLLILALLVVLVPSWYLSSLIMYPKSVCRKEHYVYCEDPAEIPVLFENVSFETSDNLVLEGWYIPARTSAKTIIMVHGHGGSQNEGLRFVKSLNNAGFNVLTYNSRVFTDGDRAYTSMGCFEVTDVIAAINFLVDKKQAKSIGLFGFSMGAATSIMAMEKDPRVRAGLFSSAYANVVDELAEVGKRDFGLPEFPLLTLSVALTNARGNMDLNSVVPENSISRISPRPVFIMHCKQDDYVNYSHALRLFKAAKEPKGFWGAACNRHEYIWNSNPQKAESIAVTFFERHL